VHVATKEIHLPSLFIAIHFVFKTRQNKCGQAGYTCITISWNPREVGIINGVPHSMSAMVSCIHENGRQKGTVRHGFLHPWEWEAKGNCVLQGLDTRVKHMLGRLPRYLGARSATSTPNAEWWSLGFSSIPVPWWGRKEIKGSPVTLVPLANWICLIGLHPRRWVQGHDIL
jgi:hypothetical protein